VRALKRFATLIEALKIDEVYAVGTAAVREARDGKALAERIEKECGIKLRILSGEEEARLSALGVTAGAPDAEGVVGDLGGASLELIEVGPKGQGRGETFPVGPLTLADENEFDYARVSDGVVEALADTKILGKRGGDFYAVGGAWRAIGRIDIALT